MEAAAAALTRSGSLRALTSPRAARPSLASPARADARPRFEPLRRATSEADLVGSAARSACLRSPRIVEETLEECLGGGGGGRGRDGGAGRRGGGGGGRSESGRRMGEYYRSMLRSEPGNALLLRNYAKYLHEVEGDLEGAEEYYGRAILAGEGDGEVDGEVLSLYGRVVWEAHREKERAAAYFERAVEAAPDDCYVLGSYASFLWDAEEDDEEAAAMAPSPALVPAF